MVRRTDVETYASAIVSQLILIKDSHREELTIQELNSLNNACNLIEHNLNNLERR